MRTIKKIFLILSPLERTRSSFLMCMVLVMAFLDMLGVASILPFMAVLTNPELVDSNAILNTAFNISRHIGIQNTEEFLFALGVAVFVMLVTSMAFKALTTYAQIRFSLMREYSIGKRLLEVYLQKPYTWFLNHHTANLGKTILSEVSNVVHAGIIPVMTLMAQSMVALAMLILLLLADPFLALSVGMVLGVSYFGIFVFMSSWLKSLGKSSIKANQERFKAVSEAFGAPKLVKVNGLEQTYIQRFDKPAKIYADDQATANIIAQLPRYALEVLAFGGMLIVILYLMTTSGSFAEAAPTIALYAFAGYRLMPALQQIYSALTQLRFIGPALDTLFQDLNGQQVADRQNNQITPQPLKQSIKLQQVSYRYENAKQSAIKNIDIIIPAYKKVGFVGVTGSGKTTVMDLILGLIEPQEGTITIDGELMTAANRMQWQRSVDYVPQQIYLSDESVAENIAFGINPEFIDQKAVERAAKIAKIHDFVIKNLPEGYATMVGELGVRLSGGQRQRIGIARALYHNPLVLVLDEATSALDNLTEEALMEALNNIGHDTTIIIVAHRLSTVRKCDIIYFLDKGQLKAFGTYDELIKTNKKFREMTLVN